MGLWVDKFQEWNFAAAPRPKTVQKSEVQRLLSSAAQPGLVPIATWSLVFIRLEKPSLRLDHFPGEGAFLQLSQEMHREINTGSRDSTFYRLLHVSSTT
jgi:hypothetical protein